MYVCVILRCVRTDSLGRRREEGQERGLRPLYPLLPARVRSRAIRVALDESAWQRLDAHVARTNAPTGARAWGQVLAWLLSGSAARERASSAARERSERAIGDWQQWQIDKERRLLSTLPAA